MAFEINLMSNTGTAGGILPQPEPQERPFERFSSDFFNFTGGLIETAGRGLETFGGSPRRGGGGGRRGQTAAPGIDPTVLMIGAGVLVLALVMRGKK